MSSFKDLLSGLVKRPLKNGFLLLLFFTCAMPLSASETAFDNETQQAQLHLYLQEARQIATEVPSGLMKVLHEEVAKNGFASAINVCRDKAPEMAKAASEKTGWHIRRVSEKNRNLKAIPDTWELAMLSEFYDKAEQGIDLASLEATAVLKDGDKTYYRYMKALPTNAMCLSCHGNSAQLHPDVKATLQSLYPADKATGYDINQIRGAITLKREILSPLR